MPTVWPIFESVNNIGEAGGGFGQVGRIDLANVTQANNFGAWASARDQGLHLLGCEVLRFVKDDVFVKKGAATHEV